MAKYVVLSVLDRVAATYGRPFYAPTRGAAIRSFASEVNRVGEGNTLNTHPGDFDLYALGEFSDDDGLFSTGQPELVILGKDVVNKE